MTIDIDAGEPAATPKPFPSLLVAALWILLFFALQIAASFIALVSTILASGKAEEIIKNPALMLQDMSLIAMPTIWALVISNLLTLGMLMVYLVQKDRLNIIRFNNWSELDLAKTIGLAVLVVGASLGFNYVYATYIIPGIDLQADLRALFAAIPDTAFNAALLFVMVAILAPLLEELLFRGLLQNALKHKMPAFAAIGLSATIFALAHVNYLAPQIEFYIFPPIFILGAAFGYLYHVTGSLRVCILLHVINNSAAMLLS